MIDAIAFVLFFAPIRLAFSIGTSLSKEFSISIQRRWTFIAREDLNEGSPLAVSRTIFQQN
jgi:hypothetical protein